ncbi:hypothetical protein GGS23DRAFT_16969 [Durotheca rogersii]|uniref:uncharacterized protein n=1 Tax=Durotheca rogersii TaxID=419775 RepID=UPI002220C789|nr:uncharacterized protein GGS23DRAFT_16969 [Durotheca rogersii]KAI5868194.1 hypothetical protein GGS23DRAFT_16969 [Durotheca rogersii]
MEYEPLAPKPQPVYGQGFWYNGRLTVRGIPRTEPSELKRLIFEPARATAEQIHEWRQENLRVVTKLWLEAQTRHYGLVLGPVEKYRGDELRELLRREAVKPDFDDLQRQYKAFPAGQFERIKAEWEAQCAAYKESCFSGRRQADFDNLATLEEKLNFDVDMFMETYYSDRATIPHPMPFRGVNFDLVMEAVSRVPGLYAQKVGTDFQRMLWIGWNKQEVKEICREYAVQAKRNAAERRLLKQQTSLLSADKNRDKVSNWRLRPHRNYVAVLNQNQSLAGSYIVEMSIQGAPSESYQDGHQWVEIRKTDSPDVYEATFDFMPAMKGVMILARDDEEIQKYIDQCDPPSQSEPPASSGGDATGGGTRAGSKRKRGQNAGSGPNPGNKRMRPVMPDVPAGHTRYYSRWRGSVGTATIDPIGERVLENRESEGWVEFLKGNTQFIVHSEAPLLSDTIRAYKIADEPKFKAWRWTTLPKLPNAQT